MRILPRARWKPPSRGPVVLVVCRPKLLVVHEVRANVFRREVNTALHARTLVRVERRAERDAHRRGAPGRQRRPRVEPRLLAAETRRRLLFSERKRLDRERATKCAAGPLPHADAPGLVEIDRVIRRAGSGAVKAPSVRRLVDLQLRRRRAHVAQVEPVGGHGVERAYGHAVDCGRHHAASETGRRVRLRDRHVVLAAFQHV